MPDSEVLLSSGTVRLLGPATLQTAMEDSLLLKKKNRDAPTRPQVSGRVWLGVPKEPELSSTRSSAGGVPCGEASGRGVMRVGAKRQRAEKETMRNGTLLIR